MAETAALTRDRILEIAGTMPAAPQVFAGLSRRLRDPNSALEQIAELIKRDAALTSHIIRVSNSPIYRGESRAGSVEEAVSRIGYQEILELAGYVAGRQLAERPLKHYGIEAESLVHEGEELFAFGFDHRVELGVGGQKNGHGVIRWSLVFGCVINMQGLLRPSGRPQCALIWGLRVRCLGVRTCRRCVGACLQANGR